MLLIHRRDIIEPVEIGDRLQIGLGFDQLLGAAMQKPDMRIDALDNFAIKLKDEPKHAMRGRVLRAEIQIERAALFGRFVRLYGYGCVRRAHFFASPAFSSPGRMYFAPSQGLRKSNTRNSCTSLTGS